MKITKILTTAVMAIGLTGASLTGAQASTATAPAPATEDSRIVGGSTVPISAAPYATQVEQNGSFVCSGSVISERWVLTADHCLGSNMTVKIGSAQRGTGEQFRVANTETWPGGDVAVLELDREYSGPVATVDTRDIARGTTGNIFGWGMTGANTPPSPQLKTANVRNIGNFQDAYGAPAYALRGIDGQAWRGDSGGPFVVNGRVAGVASTSSSFGTNPQAQANYTKLSAAESWLRETTGVTGR